MNWIILGWIEEIININGDIEYDLQGMKIFLFMKINKPCPCFRNILFIIFLFIIFSH